MYLLLYFSEHYQHKSIGKECDFIKEFLSQPIYQKAFFHKPEMLCFKVIPNVDSVSVETKYFVGVDWLITEKIAVYVEPKLNEESQVDFLGMLLSSLETTENMQHLDGLFHVEYDKPWIEIPVQKDILSPILIVQFLKHVQKIVRKGLKKSYYKITENLNSRVKGKILVSAQIKQNVLKNRSTHTVCNFQEFGINSEENQFLKYVLKFVSSYLSQRQHFFCKEQRLQLQNLLNYCSAAFEHVAELKHIHQKVILSKNVFYKEYEEALKIGNYILKRFSFNINKASSSQTTTPPFWIDMSKLFELYVYRKLKEIFPDQNSISYHDKYSGGKETDILIHTEGYKCVIDCKYKPQYHNDTVSLDDKRQLAGYTRMKSVYKKLGIAEDKIVKGVIIYSHQECVNSFHLYDFFKDENKIDEYVDFYKIGIRLPELNPI